MLLKKMVAAMKISGCLMAFAVMATDVTAGNLMPFEGMSDEAIVAYKEELYLKSHGVESTRTSVARRSQTFVVGSRQAMNLDDSALAKNVVGRQLEDGTVEISYDLNSPYQSSVSCDIVADGTKLNTPLTFMPGAATGIVQPGVGKKIIWHARKDWPNQKSDNVKAVLTVTETDAPADWANIAIEWAEWGGKDIDICGYWLGYESGKMGYSYISSSNAKDVSTAWKSMWKGDNVGNGPENVMVHIENSELGGVTANRQYRIHFNHFGEAASDPHVRVTVKCNGVTLSEVSNAATRRQSKALTSDPYVTITFDEYDTPISIKCN